MIKVLVNSNPITRKIKKSETRGESNEEYATNGQVNSARAEAISQYNESFSKEIDSFSPEVNRWANFILANLVSGRISIIWDGVEYRIPPITKIIFPDKEKWWTAVKDLYTVDGDEDTIFSPARWMEVGERFARNSAIS
jgi:hypothetical protein